MSRTCFFHAGCPDGFGAAWAVRRAWGDAARYVPRGHHDLLSGRDVEGHEVVFVDIAPPNDLLRAILRPAARVVVLDHHVSARDRYAADPDLVGEVERAGHRVVFDLNHSGAVLAWQHFHPGEEVPDLLRYVEDQDLWNWKLPRSQEVNAAIGSHPREFGTWDELAARPSSELAEEGVALVRANRIEVERALQTAHRVAVAGRFAEAVNASLLRSTIGHELAQRARYGPAWGAVYRVQGERVDVSLYSIGDLDVARIAAGYGGGGHRNAAGFSVPLREWTERFL